MRGQAAFFDGDKRPKDYSAMGGALERSTSIMKSDKARSELCWT